MPADKDAYMGQSSSMSAEKRKSPSDLTQPDADTASPPKYRRVPRAGPSKKDMGCYHCGRVSVKRGDTRNIFRCGHTYLCTEHLNTPLPSRCPTCKTTAFSSRFKKWLLSDDLDDADDDGSIDGDELASAPTAVLPVEGCARFCKACKVAVIDPTDHVAKEHNIDYSADAINDRMIAIACKLAELDELRTALETEEEELRASRGQRETLENLMSLALFC